MKNNPPILLWLVVIFLLMGTCGIPQRVALLEKQVDQPETQK